MLAVTLSERFETAPAISTGQMPPPITMGRKLTYAALSTDTNRETLDGVAQVIAIGLAHFAAATGSPGLVFIQGVADYSILPAARVVSEEEVDDPWNFWVFRLNANADLDGEATRTTRQLEGGFSASRVTPTWKLNFRGNLTFNARDIEHAMRIVEGTARSAGIEVLD